MDDRDAELIRRFLDGERRATQEVTAWVSAAACGFRRSLGDSYDDAVQDSLINLTVAWRKGAFRGDGSAAAYAKRVAVRACLKRLRQRQRRRWDLFGHLDAVLERAGLESLDAEATWRTHDLLGRIWRRASPACRRIWQLVVQGHSYREIAELEGEREGALRVRALRCRRRAEATRRRLERTGREGATEDGEHGG